MSLHQNTAEHIQSNITDKLSSAIESNPNATVNVNISKQKRKVKPLTPFVILFYHNLDYILENHPLSPFEMRVLLKLIEAMQYGNQITINQKTIVEKLKSNKQQVSRAFKNLKLTGIFFEKNGSLYMNYNVISKGELLSAKEIKEVYEEAYRLSVEKQLEIAF